MAKTKAASQSVSGDDLTRLVSELHRARFARAKLELEYAEAKRGLEFARAYKEREIVRQTATAKGLAPDDEKGLGSNEDARKRNMAIALYEEEEYRVLNTRLVTLKHKSVLVEIEEKHLTDVLRITELLYAVEHGR